MSREIKLEKYITQFKNLRDDENGKSKTCCIVDRL